MFTDKRYETILEDMLARVSAEFPNLDTREGSVIYTALAPAAVELNNLYLALGTALEMSYADTASRDYLVRRCAERGIVPYEATYAVVAARFTPEDAVVEVGTRLRCGPCVYTVTGQSSGGYPLLQCESGGAVGNLSGGSLIPVSHVEGLRSAAIVNLVIPASDAETTEALRQRYMDSYQAQAFGGNIADYREKVLGIDGVGGVRVFPAPDGPGTVGICVIGADYAPASDTVVRRVQALLDPQDASGEGRGLAPIGHQVSVFSGAGVPIHVETRLVLAEGVTLDTVGAAAQTAVEAYLLELRTLWGDMETVVVRVSQVETRLLEISGVLDVSGTRLNGEAGNVLLAETSMPVFGTLTVEG